MTNNIVGERYAGFHLCKRHFGTALICQTTSLDYMQQGIALYVRSVHAIYQGGIRNGMTRPLRPKGLFRHASVYFLLCVHVRKVFHQPLFFASVTLPSNLKFAPLHVHRRGPLRYALSNPPPNFNFCLIPFTFQYSVPPTSYSASIPLLPPNFKLYSIPCRRLDSVPLTSFSASVTLSHVPRTFPVPCPRLELLPQR